MGSARTGSNPVNCERHFGAHYTVWFGPVEKMPPMGIEPMTPGLRDQCSTTELKRLTQALIWSCAVTRFAPHMRGSVAEWSKALVLGTSLSGREFESRHCQESILGTVSAVARLAEWSKA